MDEGLGQEHCACHDEPDFGAISRYGPLMDSAALLVKTGEVMQQVALAPAQFGRLQLDTLYPQL